MRESGRVEIARSEKNEKYWSVSTLHFTDLIAMNNVEDENITGLLSNKYTIRGISIQSVQPLLFMLDFYGSDTFRSSDLDLDTYLGSVELDMSEYPAVQKNGAGQYYLDKNDLNILYEDYDYSKELHVSIQNLSPVDKLAGSSGAIQIDFNMTPRL